MDRRSIDAIEDRGICNSVAGDAELRQLAVRGKNRWPQSNYRQHGRHWLFHRNPRSRAASGGSSPRARRPCRRNPPACSRSSFSRLAENAADWRASCIIRTNRARTACWSSDRFRANQWGCASGVLRTGSSRVTSKAVGEGSGLSKRRKGNCWLAIYFPAGWFRLPQSDIAVSITVSRSLPWFARNQAFHPSAWMSSGNYRILPIG
jgi:hypothetical protein